MDEHWLPVTAAARVLQEGPADAAGVLLALHGYGQLADALRERLAEPLAAIGWALCTPEAPHRFYAKGGAPGASWMSRHGREHDIAANRRYLSAVIEQAQRRWPRRPLAVFGFSQGASQAWRVAHDHRGLAAVIALGGDIPPELHAHVAAERPPALLLRGAEDTIYPAEKLAADAAVLATQGWPHETRTLPGGHELGAAAIAALVERLAATGRPLL